VTLKNTFIGKKSWYEYKVYENQSFDFGKSFWFLNSFGVVYV